ncbi:MAG TPA: hypothetical protein VGJ18_13435 [Gemmatimonadaceae bacterium]|jgi:hypothetical protein
MTNENRRSIRIELTDDQRKQIKAASGEDVSALEFTPEELEQRIAPLAPFKYK